MLMTTTRLRMGVMLLGVCGVLLAPGAAAGGEQAPRVIEVVASRFAFEPAEIEVTVGESIRLLVRSADVEHGLAIPSLGLGATVPPGGDPVSIDFVATEAGTHRMVCSVFCGAGHERMLGRLTVLAATGRPQPTAGAASDEVDDVTPDPLEPDFSLATLPTTLRLPRGRFAFRLTHRFSRPLDGGPGYGNLAEDFFGLDSPAIIGLELRYGLLPGTQIGIYRGNNKNIQTFVRQSVIRSRGDRGLGLDIQASLEGLNNLRDGHAGSLAVILSTRLGGRAVLYAQPTLVGNVDRPGRFHPPFVFGGEDGADDRTFMLGLGGRLRVRPTVYVVGEYVPRVDGFRGEIYDRPAVSIGVQKSTYRHTFELALSTAEPMTTAQYTVNGTDTFRIGFNIYRKLR